MNTDPKFNPYTTLAMLFMTIAACLTTGGEMYNNIALYVLIPGAWILSVVNSGFSIPSNKYMILLFALYAWIAFSAIYATYQDLALSQLHEILGTFLLCYIFSSNCRNNRNIALFYVMYIIMLISSLIYAYLNIGFIFDVSNEYERLGDDNLNSNTLAYYLFYVTFASFQLSELVSNKPLSRVLDFVFLLMIPLSFVMAIVTASRQILILQVPLCATLLIVRYWLKANTLQRVLFVLLFIAAFAISFFPLSEIYDSSYLKLRSNRSLREETRYALMMEGIDVGMKNFPLGVGPGNFVMFSHYHQFTHNNYLELFANEGIIGLLLYCWLMLLYVYRQLVRFYRHHEPAFLAFFLFGAFFIFDGVFFSFYSSLWLMSFFFLVASHSEYYYETKYHNNEIVDDEDITH